MTIKEFSQKHSIALFVSTIVLFLVLVFVVFSSFGRPGPGGMPPRSMPQGGFNAPQGQGVPQQGSQGGPTGNQTPTGGPVTQ